VWTGRELVVWGEADHEPYWGSGRYQPETDTWSRLPSCGAPGRGAGSSLVSGAGELFVWGSRGPNGPNEGFRYRLGW
jgi:hypothetical protein